MPGWDNYVDEDSLQINSRKKSMYFLFEKKDTFSHIKFSLKNKDKKNVGPGLVEISLADFNSL